MFTDGFPFAVDSTSATTQGKKVWIHEIVCLKRCCVRSGRSIDAQNEGTNVWIHEM